MSKLTAAAFCCSFVACTPAPEKANIGVPEQVAKIIQSAVYEKGYALYGLGPSSPKNVSELAKAALVVCSDPNTGLSTMDHLRVFTAGFRDTKATLFNSSRMLAISNNMTCPTGSTEACSTNDGEVKGDAGEFTAHYKESTYGKETTYPALLKHCVDAAETSPGSVLMVPRKDKVPTKDKLYELILK